MNRREFLAAVSASVCGGCAAPPVRKRHAPARDAGPIAPPIIDDFEHVTNLRASSLAVHGDLLVQDVGDELWQWDLATMQRTDVLSLPHDAFAILPDGSLAVYDERESTSSSSFAARLRSRVRPPRSASTSAS